MWIVESGHLRKGVKAGQMGRVASFAPLAGLLGSVMGMIIYIAIDMMQPDFNVDHDAAAFFILLVSLLFTVPACLILGTPVIFAFRRQLESHPWRWAPVMTVLGMVIGVVSFGWMFTRPDEFRLLILCSGSSACSFALLYGINA